MMDALKKLLAVAVFCGAGASLSCGQEMQTTQLPDAPQDEAALLDDDVQALLALETFAPSKGPSAECKKINARMQKDGRAMARTKQFKAMIRTQEYKDLAKDVVEMKKKGCSMSPGGGGGDEGEGGGGINFECITLQIKAYQHQQALMATSEYKALEKTKAFKRLNADLQEAQQKGCIKMARGVLEAL